MSAIDWSLLLIPFLAGLLVLSTHVPLGREVLTRGIIFIDLAIAQVAGLGVTAAHLLQWGGEEAAGPVPQLAAAAAACLAALLLTWSGKRWPPIQEALIGLLFVFAACAGILLLAHDPRGGDHLRDLLAGQILWVGPQQLLIPALLYALLLAGWSQRWRLGDAGFYLLFALAVTVSVQLVGVFLVFASLIAPALASRRLAGKRGQTFGYAVGGAGYALGLGASALWDLPAGPAIATTLCLLALLGLQDGQQVESKAPAA
jgi:zinc/manganese transport system permease protein